MENFSPESKEMQREWSTAETVDFIKNDWQGFFHNHPQEQVRHPDTPSMVVDVVSFFTDTWDMKYHGSLEHLQKAYPVEVVISPGRLQYETEKLGKERGVPPESLVDEVFQDLFEHEYHTPEEVEGVRDMMNAESIGDKHAIGGAEVDIAARMNDDGTIEFTTFTNPEKVEQLDLDYVVFSIHPATNPILQAAAGTKEQPGDPEIITQAYEAMAQTAASVREKNPNHPFVFAGHPLSRIDARHKLTREQKERIVTAFASKNIPMEIALNDYYWSKPMAALEAETALAERVPMLDPEFLEILREQHAPVFIDTDLHYGDWVRDRIYDAEHRPEKLGRSAGDERGFSAETMANDLEGWQEKKLMSLPKYLRPQVTRFIRGVRHVLNSGIQPEQIINTKSLNEIRELQNLGPIFKT